MKDELRNYIQDELLDGREITDDENLLLSGLIDSMGVMRLVAFISERFGISVPPEDLTIENFVSLDAMAEYLSRSLPE